MSKVVWLFGRGLSMACNLTWDVPIEWIDVPSENKIQRIKSELGKAMDAPEVDCMVIRNFLDLLGSCTSEAWAHQFVTTNWDYLLQREILSIGDGTLPKWLVNSHVFHLNGTVEMLDSPYRSPFLLQEDLGTQCWESVEANKAYEAMLWAKYIVVVGMSFECETDRFLLKALNRVADDLPVGEAVVIMVNRDKAVLGKASTWIQGELPGVQIQLVQQDFESWVQQGLPELRSAGILK